MNFIKEPEREIPVINEVDVLVVGGGPAGLMAAQAAAKGGRLKVMLLEQRGYLGGNLTIGLPILAFLGPKGNQVVKGAAQKFIDRLKAKNAASEHKRCKLHMSLTIIDSEEAKTTAWEMMDEANVKVMCYTFVSDAIVENGQIKGVIIESKRGREAILAKTVIDASGDGDVAARAGVEYHKGDDKGGMQPPTLMYCMRGVCVEKLRDAICNEPEKYDMDTMPHEQFRNGNFITVGLRGRIKEAQKAGLDIPVARTILITGLKEDEIWVNMTRVNGVDSTDPDSYTHGEHEARKQMYVITDYLKRFIPGFENAWIEKVAPFMGIRESRVIEGRYVLTAQDILQRTQFPDVITVAGYPVDIHHSNGNDCTMIFCDDAYGIPYRTLLPKNIEGLLVAGRCSSMNHEAMAATRVMSTCMALGEAAGCAARIAAEDKVKVSEVNVKKVQEALLENGAFLG
ncbi:MAG: FAD-dependent oxidoreductase [Alistipes sp.]|nr:FAD-dependent oxidoreductase [Candidatus Alistipes equi]